IRNRGKIDNLVGSQNVDGPAQNAGYQCAGGFVNAERVLEGNANVSENEYNDHSYIHGESVFVSWLCENIECDGISRFRYAGFGFGDGVNFGKRFADDEACIGK